MIVFPAKGPAETEKFAFEFGDVLGGDTLLTEVVAAEGVTVGGSAIDGSLVRLVLSGGTAGTVAKVTCTVTTSGGETFAEVAVLEIGGAAVSLAEAKAWIKKETDNEDALIGGLVRSAVGAIEAKIGKKLTAKIVTQTVDGFPCDGTIGLWHGPVSEVLAIAYDDGDGLEQALDSFRLVEGANAKLLPAYGESFPTTAIGAGTVRLTYVAGYDPAELPPELCQAVLMLMAHWYQNREAVSVAPGVQAVELPLGVEMMIAPYRPVGLA
jgi:uncharacterized phiE125 gp8 family phage protein